LKKVYFPNLNSLRFFAALMVIVHHLEQFKFVLGYKNYWAMPSVQIIGKLGVILFFVLSGFLITYLLLAEKKTTKNISIRSFYIRRILRIWPLYYLLVFLSFAIFSNIDFLSYNTWSDAIFDNIFSKLALYILFLPNLAVILYLPVPFVAHSWSVGVEEQFYLIWPVLIKYFRKTELLLYGIVFGYLLFVLMIRMIGHFFGWSPILETFSSFLFLFHIDCMAIGGLLAYYLFNKKKIIRLLFHKYIQVITLLVLIIFIGLGIKIPYIHYEFYAVFFGILIVNLAANEKAILNLENKLFKYFGKISYGLYMYHPLAIVISLKILNEYGLNLTIFQYTLSLLISILLSGISYRFYEQYFIKKKIRFSSILSGDNVNPDNEKRIQYN